MRTADTVADKLGYLASFCLFFFSEREHRE